MLFKLSWQVPGASIFHCRHACHLFLLAKTVQVGRGSVWVVRTAGLARQNKVCDDNIEAVSLPSFALRRTHSGALPRQMIDNERSWKEALHQSHQQDIEGLAITYASLLRSCSDTKTLSDGMLVHELIIKNGLEQNVFMENLLLQMYGNCGVLRDARVLFDKILQRNVFSWTFIIRVYAEQGQVNEAFRLFGQMQGEGVIPDKFVYISMLSACASETTLYECKKLHTHILSNGFASEIVVGTSLVNMYRRCKSPEHAQRTFSKLLQRDVFMYNVMMATYVQNGQENCALHLFYEMQETGLMPDKVTFISTLSACVYMGAFDEGRQMHARIVGSKVEGDVNVSNALVSMYGKAGSPSDARIVFNKMAERNVISWNAMIAAYTQNGQSKNAIHLYKHMQEEDVKPNNVTFLSTLSACASQADLREGRLLHAHVVEGGVDTNVAVGNALVTMYAKCGSSKNAQMVFDRMPERDVVSWTAIIVAYAENDQSMSAFELFTESQLQGITLDRVALVSIVCACTSQVSQMQSTPVADGHPFHDVGGDALVNACDKSGSLNIAQRIFDRLPVRNVVLWNAMIAAYAQSGQAKAALDLFEQMMWDGVIPDKFVFASALCACASQGNLAEGRCIHASIVGRGFESDTVVGNALINMYGKYGIIEDAQMLFDMMPEHDTVSWTAIMATYAQHGHGEIAIQLFEQMQLEGFMPDRVTFVSISSACANHAALAQGKQLHTRILGSGMNIDVVTGNAVVNMYGKCGSLDIALKTFENIPKKDVISWNVMIAAYAQNGQGKDALHLFRQMRQQTILPNKVTFVCVLSACSHGGLIDDGWKHLTSMHQDYGLIPVVDHYNSMVDLLGRLGRLDEAESLINNMPFKPTVVSWMTLLGACRYQVDLQRGLHAASFVFELDPLNAAPYVMLANICAATGQVEDAALIIKVMKEKGLKKPLGCSCIEVNGKVYELFSDGQVHPQEGIYAEQQSIRKQLNDAGYSTNADLLPFGLEKNEYILDSHSEMCICSY